MGGRVASARLAADSVAASAVALEDSAVAAAGGSEDSEADAAVAEARQGDGDACSRLGAGDSGNTDWRVTCCEDC